MSVFVIVVTAKGNLNNDFFNRLILTNIPKILFYFGSLIVNEDRLYVSVEHFNILLLANECAKLHR